VACEERLTEQPSRCVANVDTVGTTEDGSTVGSGVVEDAPYVLGDVEDGSFSHLS